MPLISTGRAESLPEAAGLRPFGKLWPDSRGGCRHSICAPGPYLRWFPKRGCCCPCRLAGLESKQQSGDLRVPKPVEES
jgi:hypothetical protein